MFADGSEWELSPVGTRLCESCGTEPATIHIVRIESGEVRHSQLCAGCAEEAVEEPPAAVIFALPSGLAGIVGQLSERAAEKTGEPGPERICAICGTTSHDIEETGLLGCAACYESHAEAVDRLLGRAAENVPLHEGKLPRRSPQSLLLRREVHRLERMLEELVVDERFEEAAGVRDRLAELMAELGTSGQ